MADMTTTAKSKIQDAGNTCAQAATSAAEGIRNAAEYVSDQAKEAACNASKMGTFIDSKCDDATTALGSGLMAAGDAIRERGPHDGRMGQASSAFAQTLSNTGEYIQREGLHGIESDVANLIKRNPIPSLLMGVGLGFLIARAAAHRS